MNKVYLIAPLALLLVFTGFYAAHRSGHEQRETEKAAATAAALQARNEAEQEARRAAMTEAIAQAEQRKKEREARLAREVAEKEARQVQLDTRDKAYREQERSARQIERVQKELEAEQAVLAKLAVAQKDARAELTFLRDFVTRAQDNVRALQTLLTKLAEPAAAPVTPAK